MDGRTDNTRENNITTSRDCGSATWIKNRKDKLNIYSVILKVSQIYFDFSGPMFHFCPVQTRLDFDGVKIHIIQYFIAGFVQSLGQYHGTQMDSLCNINESLWSVIDTVHG